MSQVVKQHSGPCQGGARLAGRAKVSTPQQPLISVVTVVLNAAEQLAATIHSIAGQGYENLEYVVIDGASSDGTVDLLRSREDVVDFWLSEADGGLYHAMNKALEHVRGDWVIFLGAGDLLVAPLQEMVQSFSDPSTVYYGDVYLPTRHMLYHGPFSAHKLSRFNLPHQAVFYPRGLFRHHRYDPRYPIKADYVCNIRAYCDKRYKFQYVRALVTIYEDREGISSRCRDTAFDRDIAAILTENFGRLYGCEYRLRSFFRSFERRVLRKILRAFKTKKPHSAREGEPCASE